MKKEIRKCRPNRPAVKKRALVIIALCVTVLLLAGILIAAEIIGGSGLRAVVELFWGDEPEDGEITMCRIIKPGSRILLRGEVPELPKSDDKYFYLFELATYEEEIGKERDPVTFQEKSGEFAFTFNLNHRTPETRLYSKFVVAVKKDGEFVPVSDAHYITNPEILADQLLTYPESESIKGLLVDPAKLATTELEDLGVKQAVYNIPVANIVGPTTNPYHPTIHYEYDGVTYLFNGQVIAEYDHIFRVLTEKGLVTTAILLNNKSTHYTDLVHPRARSGNKQSLYYMFNAAEEEGVAHLAAITTFLAERYSGDSGKGEIANWIVGNEINARKQWNYMEYMDIEDYVKEYVRALRVIYTAIRSEAAEARVYISLDQQWNRNLNPQESYDARDILDVFNRQITEQGNIDWGLGHHPFPAPLNWARFWDMPTSYKRKNYVTDTVDSPMVTIQNIHVATDYMQREEMLTEAGEVRSVLLSELGFTSSTGEELQAAAFVYAYYIAESNQHIDGFLLSRETDAGSEIAQGLALGICRPDGSLKFIADAYQYIDTEEAEAHTDFAKDLIGISDWSEVISVY